MRLTERIRRRWLAWRLARAVGAAEVLDREHRDFCREALKLLAAPSPAARACLEKRHAALNRRRARLARRLNGLVSKAAE